MICKGILRLYVFFAWALIEIVGSSVAQVLITALINSAVLTVQPLLWSQCFLTVPWTPLPASFLTFSLCTVRTLTPAILAISFWGRPASRRAPTLIFFSSVMTHCLLLAPKVSKVCSIGQSSKKYTRVATASVLAHDKFPASPGTAAWHVTWRR